MGADERLTGITSERFSEYMATNVVGPHRVMNAFLPALRSRKTRIIVYISSIVASITKEVNSNWGLQGPYATSKAAGNMLTVQFHNELRGKGSSWLPSTPVGLPLTWETWLGLVLCLPESPWRRLCTLSIV